MNTVRLSTWRLLAWLTGILSILLVLIGILGRGSMEDMMRGPNLPALFLYLAMGNDPNATVGNQDIYATDVNGKSVLIYKKNAEPLIYAALNIDSVLATQKVILLVMFGANVNAKTKGGDTALGLALSNRLDGLSCYLLRHGAKPDFLSETDREALKNLKCAG